MQERTFSYYCTEYSHVSNFSCRKPKSQEFIRDAVEIRLRMILPFIETWPQAMAIQAMPQNAPESLRNLSQLVDDIWFYAGDRSVDVSRGHFTFLSV